MPIRIPEYHRTQDVNIAVPQQENVDALSISSKAGAALGKAVTEEALSFEKAFLLAKESQLKRENELDILKTSNEANLKKRDYYENQWFNTVDGRNRDEKFKELQEEFARIDEEHKVGKNPYFIDKYNKIAEKYNYGIYNMSVVHQAQETAAQQYVETDKAAGTIVSRHVETANAAMDITKALGEVDEFIQSQETLSPSQKAKLGVKNQYRLMEEVTKTLIQNKSTREAFIMRMDDMKQREEWLGKIDPDKQADYRALIQAARKDMAIDKTVEVLQAKFNLIDPQKAEFDKAHLALLDSNFRREMKIDFTQAREISSYLIFRS